MLERAYVMDWMERAVVWLESLQFGELGEKRSRRFGLLVFALFLNCMDGGGLVDAWFGWSARVWKGTLIWIWIWIGLLWSIAVGKGRGQLGVKILAMKVLDIALLIAWSSLLDACMNHGQQTGKLISSSSSINCEKMSQHTHTQQTNQHWQ
ncbi:hypothetical protein IWX46DRAFT_202942 [Phyllosticta citricarpa]|uniref:Uncharacterized protein n=1 Tax=Phyllosticta citricarpa TaxID=55181 RepID=A0ABR1LVC8_9PEZI